MNYLRLIGGIAGLLALVSVAFLVKDRFHQKTLADAAAACAVAASDPLKPVSDCLPSVKQRIEEARQAFLCDGALLPALKDEHRFAAQQACGAGVKRLIADRDAAAGESANLRQQLDTALAGRDAAVARAETRAAHQDERTGNARKAIDTAPRDDAGRIHCDAECLRRIAG